jgi:5-methylcytosine-specific restriction enzyme A
VRAAAEGAQAQARVKARGLALARDGGRCRRCLRPASDVHHRKVKGMGGTSDEGRACGLPNLISVCRPCHSWIHLHPTESYEQGWLVHSWDSPEDIPVRTEGKYAF